MDPRFILTPNNRDASNKDVLSDIRRVAAQEPSAPFLTYRRYAQAGRFSITLIVGRFGSWNRALTKARLPIHPYRIPDEEFHAQMEKIWRTLGQQPTRSAFSNLPTTISSQAYIRRFGSWRTALLAFTTRSHSSSHSHPKAHPLQPPRTPRDPSFRLRHQILKRDNYKCVQCGRSPATNPKIILHIDHIHPWSKGGQTTPENLQTLCHQCNRGKSNTPP